MGIEFVAGALLILSATSGRIDELAAAYIYKTNGAELDEAA